MPPGTDDAAREAAEQRGAEGHEPEHRTPIDEVRLLLARKPAGRERQVEVGDGAECGNGPGDESGDQQRGERDEESVHEAGPARHTSGGVAAPHEGEELNEDERNADADPDAFGGLDLGGVDAGGGEDAAEQRREEEDRPERDDDSRQDGQQGHTASHRRRAYTGRGGHDRPPCCQCVPGLVACLYSSPHGFPVTGPRSAGEPHIDTSEGNHIRYLVVVDGEHYPPVVEAALRDLAEAGRTPAAAIFVGGKEKLPSSGEAIFGDLPVRIGDDPRRVLEDALVELAPDAVVDLSDEPVLDPRRRNELASVALYHGVPYEGSDFRFTPPPRPHVCAKPSIAVIGTGKRTGKTAVAGFAARVLVGAGRRPVVVAMGRGGPPEPEVLRGDEVDLTPDDLLELADAGKHAASDYIEDAMLGRVPTVGCRRCGGGMAGAVGPSNVARGIVTANELPGDLLLLEGSGSAIPPAHADVTGLVVPASCPDEYLAGYFGPYRLLLADFVVVTMCEYPFGTPSQVSRITDRIRTAFRSTSGPGGVEGEIQVARTVFRPSPTRSVEGRSAYVATTAPEPAGESITRWLEQEHGCRVAGMSHALSDRARLETDLEMIDRGGIDVLLCEIKAAGIDVATRRALDAGIDVIYMDNVPVGIDDDDPAEIVRRAGDLAVERYENGQK